MKVALALVTGASRGLGRETCRQLADKGFRVIATHRLGDPAGVQLDVTSRASIDALARRLHDAGETLDLLVNNAGVYDGSLDDVLATNFFGPMHVTDALQPLMRDGGAIVMVSSGMGEISAASPALREQLLDPQISRDDLLRLLADAGLGWPSLPYRTSKIALNTLTRIYARAWPRLRVNAVCPGWVRTDMGGAAAPRSVEKGAASIVAAAMLPPTTTGTFSRDGKQIEW